VEKLNPPGGIGIKEDALLNTPTLTWVNARRGYIKKILPFKLDAVCLIKKFKMSYEKTFAQTKTKEKLI
jgi:hypothetical protein